MMAAVGGEPLLRPDLPEVVRRLARLTGPDGPVQVAMTTNGIRLAEVLPDLVDAGLGRMNISVDTLDRDRFRALTRRDRLDDVRATYATSGSTLSLWLNLPADERLVPAAQNLQERLPVKHSTKHWRRWSPTRAEDGYRSTKIPSPLVAV